MDPRLASATEPRPIPSTSSVRFSTRSECPVPPLIALRLINQQPKRSPGKQLQWRFLALPRPIFFPGDLLSMSTHMEAGRKQAETQNQQRDRALAQGASIQPTDPPNRGNTRSLHQFFSTDAEVKTRILVNRSPSVLRLLTCCCCLWAILRILVMGTLPVRSLGTYSNRVFCKRVPLRRRWAQQRSYTVPGLRLRLPGSVFPAPDVQARSLSLPLRLQRCTFKSPPHVISGRKSVLLTSDPTSTLVSL